MKHKLQLLLCFLFLGVNAFSQNIPSYVPTNGLVGWWPFNGNANDESGNGNHGTVNGATLTSDRSGAAGKAYSFDGVNDNIILNSLNISNLSLNFWINIDLNINTNPNNGHPPIGSVIIGQGTQHNPTVTYSDFALGVSSYGSNFEYISFENSDLTNNTWTDYNLSSLNNLKQNWSFISTFFFDHHLIKKNYY
jgi:hypothetical protein